MATQVSFGPRFTPRSAPVTFWLLVTFAALLLLRFASSAGPGGAALDMALAYQPGAWLQRPWTLLTWPLLNFMGPFWALLAGWFFWWVGSDLERWWGSRIHGAFLLGITVTTALAVSLGAALLPQATVNLLGALPLGEALLCVWGLRNPRATVILLIVPVTGTVLVALAVATVWFAYGVVGGFFACLGSCGVAALYWWRGERLHALLRRLPPDPAKRTARRRDQRFEQIMKQSGLRLVDDEDERR
ncbi:MAG: rhomboid family intramembrane serine protease [Fimbriimonadaceae bacterium]|nr:rhomboid family intramembrane serine protease [Fimbriimonadaceae bacterium]